MLESAQKNLELFFPHYRSPSQSRFIKLFAELTNNTFYYMYKEMDKSNANNQFKEQNEKVFEDENSKENDQYQIIISKIKSGNEKRTSIIIKGIPSSFGCQNFYQLIKQFYKNVNFFYIPGYVCTQKEYMYAFVNVANSKGIINIYNGLKKIRDCFSQYSGYDMTKVEVYFSKAQGYKSLKRKYTNEYFNNFLVC